MARDQTKNAVAASTMLVTKIRSSAFLLLVSARPADKLPGVIEAHREPDREEDREQHSKERDEDPES
jgi:hypothetical protein